MCKIPNLPLEEIDPKCREFVYLLNKYGFKTQFSCQGHYNGDKYYIMFDKCVSDEEIYSLIKNIYTGYSPSYEFTKWARMVGKKGKESLLVNWVYEINSKIQINNIDVSMEQNHFTAKSTCKRFKDYYDKKGVKHERPD